MNKMKKLLSAVALAIALGFSGGSVQGQVSPIPAYTCTVAQITVTNATQQFLAANGLRKIMIVQNNDATANVFVNIGASATTAGSIKVGAGQNLYMSNPLPVQAINAIGSTASNANVILVECS